MLAYSAARPLNSLGRGWALSSCRAALPVGPCARTRPRWTTVNVDSHGRQSTRFISGSRSEVATESLIAKNPTLGSTGPGEQQTRQRRRRRIGISIFVLGGLVGGIVGWSGDGWMHALMAVQRSARVVGALAVCINDYRQTLKLKDEQPEEYDELLKACHLRCAERTRAVMEKNGSVFIKLGQHLSSMNYILPAEWCNTFVPLQDQCPVSSIEAVRKMILDDTGHDVDTWFSDFEDTPIGAASLAQVHRARLRDSGELVAVKVQHPVLDEWSKLDIRLTQMTFRTLKRWFPEFDLTWLSEEMETSIPQELDFTLEAHNARVMSDYFRRRPECPLVIPQVRWAHRRILVMEYLAGARLDDLEYMDKHGINRDKVATSLARIFNQMIFGDGAPLHCDPHAGNLAIRLNPNRGRGLNFDLILYDHGLYRNIPTEMRRSYARLWLSLIDADEAGIRTHAREVAGIDDDDFMLFASAITGKPFEAIRQGVGSASSLDRSRKTDHELMSSAISLESGMLSSLIMMLGRVPNILLLILKTNDLTRSLCDGLQTRLALGPVRSFLILGEFAARTVYDGDVEAALSSNRSFIHRLFSLAWIWSQYVRVRTKLAVYRCWLDFRAQLVLLRSSAPAV